MTGKNKNTGKIFAAAFMLVVLTFLIYSFLQPYDRIDVIEKDDLRFKLLNRNTVGKAYVISEKTNLAINNTPENITMICNNRESFTLDIENKDDNIVQNIDFLIQNVENLKFEFPRDFIVPPKASRKMTFFVDADCSNAPAYVEPILTVKGTDLTFGFSIYVEDRKE